MPGFLDTSEKEWKHKNMSQQSGIRNTERGSPHSYTSNQS